MLLFNKLRDAIVIAAMTAMGLAAGQAQDSGPAATQASRPPPDLAASLNQAAEPLQIKDAVEIHAYLEGPLVTWTVYFDAHAVSALIDKQATSAPAESVARWFGWYRSLNEKLLQITRKESQRTQERLNLETDVSVEFCRGSLADRIYTEVCKFRGSRCTYVDNVPPGLDLAAPPAVKTSSLDVRVTVTIRPTKTTWSAREAISGTVIWENSGKQRVAMRPIEMPQVAVRREDGTSPPRLRAKIFICGTPVASLPPVVLMPGERHETLFSIETDPLDLGGAVLLADGRYDLYVPDMKDQLNIPTECKPVRVEVRTSPDQDLSPRITFFDAGDSRLVVVRENGDFEAYDVGSGRRVANGHVADYVPMPRWEGEFEVSPDGKRLALVRQPYGGPPANGIELYRLDADNARATELPLPDNTDKYDRPRLQRFSPDGRLIFLTSRKLIWAVNSSTGAVEWKTSCAEREQLTLDGQQRVCLTSKAVEFIPRESPDKLMTINLGDIDRVELALVGHKGVYLTDRESHSASYVSFDGQRHPAFGEHVEYVLAEAPDAAFVALRERQEGTYFDNGPIAIWQVSPPKLLWRLADKKPRQVVLAAQPACVICGLGNEHMLGVDTYSATFEVYELESGQLTRTIEARYRAP